MHKLQPLLPDVRSFRFSRVRQLMSNGSALLIPLCCSSLLFAQVIINEGSNRNFSTIYDEDGNANDWIELYNSGIEAINLEGYSLSDAIDASPIWSFSSYVLEPGEFLLVFCSDKDRQYIPPFQQVAFEASFVPQVGWNVHNFDDPFIWDGTSDIVINACSWNPEWNTNSIFNQSQAGYVCTVVAHDNPESICSESYGETFSVRPNIQLNGITIGTGTINNSSSTYPAPYGNWWECARNQSLYKAEELQDAGLSAGPIENLAWDIVSTQAINYNYIDISFRHADLDEMTNAFFDNTGMYFHTNFKLNSIGETIYLLDPEDNVIDQLEVGCPYFGTSIGSSEDGIGDNLVLFPPTPGSSNNSSEAGLELLPEPLISLESGVYSLEQNTLISDVSGLNADIRYTLNGDEPVESSPLYVGESLPFSESTILRAKAFKEGYIPSPINSKTYLIDVSHTTPIVSVVVEDDHLFGSEGIFTNWWEDSERYAQIMYFDSSEAHPLLFEREAAIQVDGGNGGSRSHPQTSFRLELAKGSLNEDPVDYPLFPNRPERDEYSKIYLRNGSNMWLSLPYKDGAQVEMMAGETNAYFSAMRPITVYINGEYFGVYELREKFDDEYFEEYDDYSVDDIDILTVSNWYGGQLRANEGEVSNYWNSWEEFSQLDAQSADFVDQADQLFDMQYLSDYIIAETWMGNTDWPWNNIKVYRSDATGYRWRFCTIDLENCLWPWPWEECDFNGLQYVLDLGDEDPFTGVWYKSIQNSQYEISFINRYADVLNTSYRIDRLLAIDNNYFQRWLPEMLQEYQRWVDPGSVAAWHEAFVENHELFQEDLVCKSEVIRDQIQEVFELEDQVTLTLDVEPSGAGIIHLNTISPEVYPWDGIYYHGVPVSMTAQAMDGYEFLYWEDNGEIIDPNDPNWEGELNLDEVNFTAVFQVQPVGVQYSGDIQNGPSVFPIPANRELYMEHTSRRISGWELYTSDGRLVLNEYLSLSQQFVLIPVEKVQAGSYVLRIKYLEGKDDVQRVSVVR